jgi:hypothetical protein
MTLYETHTSKAKSVTMEMMTMMSTLVMNGGEPPNDNACHKPQPQNIDLSKLSFNV